MVECDVLHWLEYENDYTMKSEADSVVCVNKVISHFK